MLAARTSTVELKKELPVSEIEFCLIQEGDLVRYHTRETGHTCGWVKGRDIDKKRKNSGTKYLRNNTAPLIVTIRTIGLRKRQTVSLTREQLLEWRPQTAKAN